MKVFRSVQDLPAFKNAVVAIGAMDGVHYGHRAIIAEMCSLAAASSGESVLVIFHPHPRKVVFPNDDSLKLITLLDEKIELLRETGLDNLVIIPFTVEFSQIDPRLYVEDILIKRLKARHIIIGYDHRFGLNRAGDVNLLKEYEAKGFFSLTQIEKQQIDDLQISSTRIRRYIQNGELYLANKLLVSPFRISGTIERGEGIATKMGYPTANVSFDSQSKILPPAGSYAATCILDGKSYEGMLYIGYSRTLKKTSQLLVEMNIFNHFREDLYGKAISITPVKFLRKDAIYSSRQELLFNIEKDRIESGYILSRLRPEFTKCCVAILNYNGRELLKEYLPSILQMLPAKDCKVFVIDNGSSDGSSELIRSEFPSAGLIELSENQGFANGYNQGSSSLACEYLVLVNSDVRFTEKWIEESIQLMDSDRDIAAMQVKVHSDRKPEYFEYAGAGGGLLDRLAYPLCRGRILDISETDEGQYDGVHESFWATGACSIVRKEYFDLIGGFDSKFFAHQEEIDLCWRFKKMGWRILSNNEYAVRHLGGATLDYANPRKNYLNFRNNYLMFLKNEAKFFDLLALLLRRLIIDIAFAFSCLLRLQFAAFRSTCAGILSALNSVGHIRRERKKIYFLKRRLGNPLENKVGRLSSGLLYHYFFRGRKNWRQWPESGI